MLNECGRPTADHALSSKPGASAPFKSPRVNFHSRLILVVWRSGGASCAWRSPPTKAEMVKTIVKQNFVMFINLEKFRLKPVHGGIFRVRSAPKAVGGLAADHF